MKTVKLSDFNAYLNEQIGQPYVCGGRVISPKIKKGIVL